MFTHQYHILNIIDLYRCDSSSGRRSPHIKDNIKKSNGIVHPGNTPRLLMLVLSKLF